MVKRSSAAEPKTHGSLRVLINAALTPGQSGGIEQSTSSLIAALGRLEDGEEEYLAVTDESAPEWLDPILGPNTTVVVRERPRRRPIRPVDVFTRGPRRALRAAVGAYRQLTVPAHRRYDLFVERLAPDVVHFPYQWFQHTSAPSLFSPHDLQHLHHPEFFSDEARADREAAYRLSCRWAAGIEVQSTQSREDIVRLLGIPRSKVYVVMRPAPTSVLSESLEEDLDRVAGTYALPPEFVYYPAQSWPHKNHLVLVQALAALRRSGHVLHLVLSGAQTPFWSEIQAEIGRLGLDDQITALGYVPQSDIRPLYRLAAFTVFPTLFEGYGLPAQEAITEGSPLACSNLPVLAERLGDAAEYFDPRSVNQIADSLLRLHSDPTYRSELRSRGTRIASAYSWENAARTYRALYRKLAGAPTHPTDTLLLEAVMADRVHPPPKNDTCRQ